MGLTVSQIEIQYSEALVLNSGMKAPPKIFFRYSKKTIDFRSVSWSNSNINVLLM